MSQEENKLAGAQQESKADKQAEGEDKLNKVLSEGYRVIRDIDTPPSIVYVLGLYDQGSDSDD